MALFSGVRQRGNNFTLKVLTAKERGAKFKNANEVLGCAVCELNLIEKGKSPTLLPTNAKSPIYGRPSYTKQMVLDATLNLLKTIIHCTHT